MNRPPPAIPFSTARTSKHSRHGFLSSTGLHAATTLSLEGDCRWRAGLSVAVQANWSTAFAGNGLAVRLGLRLHLDWGLRTTSQPRVSSVTNPRRSACGGAARVQA